MTFLLQTLFDHKKFNNFYFIISIIKKSKQTQIDILNESKSIVVTSVSRAAMR